MASELKICVARVPRFNAAEAARSSLSFELRNIIDIDIGIYTDIYPLLANLFINILRFHCWHFWRHNAKQCASFPLAATLLPLLVAN